MVPADTIVEQQRQGSARLLIQVWDGELLLHEFTRSTTNRSREGLSRMIDSARGWLQAWGDQVSPEQWDMDIRRVLRQQPGGKEVG